MLKKYHFSPFVGYLIASGLQVSGFVSHFGAFVCWVLAAIWMLWDLTKWEPIRNRLYAIKQKFPVMSFVVVISIGSILGGVIFGVGWKLLQPKVSSDNVAPSSLGSPQKMETRKPSQLDKNPENEKVNLEVKVKSLQVQRDAPSPRSDPPRVSHIRIASQNRGVSEREDLPYRLDVVVQTDQTIQPVAFLFKCTSEVGYIASGIGNVMMKLRPVEGQVIGHPDWFVVQWDSPAFTPSQNMEVLILSKKDLRVVELEQIRPDSLQVRIVGFLR